MYIACEHDGGSTSRWAVSDAGGIIGPRIDCGTHRVLVHIQCSIFSRRAFGKELDGQGLGILTDKACVTRQRDDRIYDAGLIAEVIGTCGIFAILAMGLLSPWPCQGSSRPRSTPYTFFNQRSEQMETNSSERYVPRYWRKRSG